MMMNYPMPCGTLDALQTGPLLVNTYIVPLGGDDVFVVDPAACKFSRDQEMIIGYLAAHKKHPVGIFLTHAHFDHILGVSALLEAFDNIPVAVSTEDERALTDESLDFHQGTLHLMEDDGGIAGGLRDVIKAARGRIRTFADGDTLSKVFAAPGCDESASAALGKWTIMATPGHTMGSVCLYQAAEGDYPGYLISGDTVFFCGWGRTDMGGNHNVMMQSLKSLRRVIPPKTLVLPGHDRYGFEFGDWRE